MYLFAALHGDVITVQFDFYTGRYLNRSLCNARHSDPPLEYGADNFATNALSAGSAISHHAFAGGDNSDTQTTVDLRQSCGCVVSADQDGSHA